MLVKCLCGQSWKCVPQYQRPRLGSSHMRIPSASTWQDNSFLLLHLGMVPTLKAAPPSCPLHFSTATSCCLFLSCVFISILICSPKSLPQRSLQSNVFWQGGRISSTPAALWSTRFAAKEFVKLLRSLEDTAVARGK